MKKDILLITAVIVVILLGTGGVFAYWQQAKPAATPAPTATSTLPAAPASHTSVPTPIVSTSPTNTNTYGTSTVALGQKIQIAYLTVTPLSIVQDSRCPVDVVCIQAGTVQVSARITSFAGSLTQTLTLNKPFLIGTETVTLTDVQPTKHEASTLQPSDYELTFAIAHQ